jgi:cytochrome c-type biogenesis protein
MSAGGRGKLALGLILVVFGGLVVTGADKAIGVELVNASPDWLNELTTRF